VIAGYKHRKILKKQDTPADGSLPGQRRD